MISKDSTLKFIKMIEEHETLRELRHKINSNAYSPESLIVKFQNLENILDERMIQFKDNIEDLDFWFFKIDKFYQNSQLRKSENFGNTQNLSWLCS